MAIKKPTRTDLVAWEKEMAAEAEAATHSEQTSGGQFIGTRGGRLSWGGAAVPGNAIRVVILDYCRENTFYAGKFDPDTPQSPVCYAFARDERELAPHEKAVQPQADACTGCPQNEFGSADTGRGKACKNTRRLALVAEDSADDEDAEIFFLKVPVTSVKAWSGYVQAVADSKHRPPHGVVTEISLVPDAKTQFQMEFRLADVITDAGVGVNVRALRAKLGDAGLMFPYAVYEAEEKPAKTLKGARGKR